MSPSLTLLSALRDRHDQLSKQADELDWDGLAAGWQEVEIMFTALAKIPLSDIPLTEKTEARQYIEELLATQKKLSACILPWMEQVRPLLDSFSRFAPPETTEEDQKRQA
jgi:hypothetical protein